MTGIDRRDDFLRRSLEEAQRAEQARRAEEAAARAAQLAAELARAIAEANAREAARVMTEANRLPQEAQRAFFAAAGDPRSASPVETVRDTITGCFPAESEARLELGAELARQQGADPRAMSRTALEAVASRSIDKLGGILARVQARGSAIADVVERRQDLGRFTGEPVRRSATAEAAPVPASPAPAAGEAAAVLLRSEQPGTVAEARAWSEISPRRPDVFERPAANLSGPLSASAGAASSLGSEFDRAALREALGQARTALGKKALDAQVEPLKWTESARHVVAPGMARVRERLAEVKEGVSRAREALAQGPTENLRVLYGKSEASSAFDGVIERVRAAHESLIAPATTGDRRGFFTAVEQARAELGAAQAHVGEAGVALTDLVGADRVDVRAAMADVQEVEQAARAAEGELALVEGRARVLEDADATGGVLTEAAEAPLGPPEEAAVGDEPGVFTEADLQKIGSGLDPAKRPPQTLWNENMVNEVSSLGRTQGGITEEQGGKNAELARSLLVPEGTGEEAAVELTAVDVAAALKASGMALERVDPNQLGAAARYINTGTTRAEQAEKLRKTLDNFQVLDRIGLPKMSRGQLMGQLDTYAKIPGKATSKLKEKDLLAKFQEVAATLNGGGDLKTKIGKYQVELKVDANGTVLKAKAKKKGLFSRIVSGITKVAKIVTPIALTVMSFIPVTAPFALAANAAISAYKAIKAKSWLGVVAAGASLVGAGVGIIAGKAASIAGTVANKVSTIANATARTLQGVQAARQGNVLGAIAGVAGAVAGGVSQVAGAFGEKMGKFADTMNKYAARVTSGVMAVDAARRGDYLGAVGLGASLAADFNFTGPSADKYLRHVGNGAMQARAAQTAIRRGDYFAAGAAFSSLAAGIAHGNPSDPNATPAHPSLVRDLRRVAGTFSYLSTAQSSVRSRDYFGAASALTQAAGLHVDERTRKQMVEVSSYLQRAGGAYTRASRGDYLGAAGELSSLASNLPWDAKTKVHLLDAADVFKAGSGIPGAIKSGDFLTAASLMSQAASVFADGNTKTGLTDAAMYLAEGAPAYNLLRRGDYRGAAAVLGQMAATHGLLPGTKNLETATTVIQTVDGATRALQAGDYARAASIVRSAVGPHLGGEASSGLEQAGSAIEAMSRVQRALRERDWVAAAEAAGELARVLEQGRLVRTPPIALTSAAGGLKRAAAAGNEQQIQAEATRLGSALAAIAPELGGPLQTLAQNETQAALGAQAESLVQPATGGPPPEMSVPAPVYAVKSGDTLSGIARRFGTTVQDILSVNPAISNPDRIFAGQLIRIPTTGAVSITSGAAAQPAGTTSPAGTGMPAPVSTGATSQVSFPAGSGVLDDALHALEATALNAGAALINDAGVRANYVRRIKEMADQIRLDVSNGVASAEEGARFANQLRNGILEEARAQSSSVGRAVAESMKSSGQTLEQGIEKAVGKLFPGRTFAELSTSQRRQVFMEIIEAAGRSRPAVTSSIPRWRLMGKGCLLFTAAVATYNIWTAENKVKAGLKEGLVLGGGAAGGALAGAATGLVCGPGAPICSTALFVVGGIMGAMAGDAAGNLLDEELDEFSKWLSDGP
jgi:LysM repeat protein